jgi:radical SAM superfamily enzyme YgiQ (UPF0313 family)
MVEYARLDHDVAHGVEFVLAEQPRRAPARDVAAAILAADADLVAISNYAWTYRRICDALDVLERSGAKLPRILLGGPNSSGAFGADLMRRHRSISAMVEGEGEPAFRDVCAALASSLDADPFAAARNCVVRDESGEIVRPNLGHRITVLDEVPSPYLSGLLPAQPSPIFYETNRGCPYRCSFCYWGNGNSKVYRMSPERIRAEMEFFARSRVSSFWIADANFGIFPSDADIAAMMAEVNERHGRPFKLVGVNWAKQSSDRVLEIAKIFRTGGMACTTTMALQSVTPEAERAAKRYSMAPSKFASLIRSASESDLDTYTDVIWGLPGESFDEFLDGLGAIAATGVPAILMHQLYLLPGTEFFDRRRELGLTMLSESGEEARDGGERSDFAEYIVVGHDKMSRADLVRGTRILGANHVLHNHDLGRVATFYLMRHGVTHRQVLETFDAVVMGEVPGFDDPPGSFLAEVRERIRTFAEDVGLDEYAFYYQLSNAVWFARDAGGRKRSRATEVRDFVVRFFAAVCARHGVVLDAEDELLLREVATYNALVAPKPAWRPDGEYAFTYDVHAIWADMQRTIHGAADRVRARAERGVAPETWPGLVADVARALRELLTPEYLRARRTEPRYFVENGWRIAPVLETADWLLSSRSKHCTVRHAPRAA